MKICNISNTGLMYDKDVVSKRKTVVLFTVLTILLLVESILPQPLHAQDQTPRFIFRGHREAINALCLSPTGDTLYSASDDGTIRMWDTETGISIAVLSRHSDKVKALAINKSGTLLCSGGNDKKIFLWNIARKDTLYSLIDQSKLTNLSNVQALAFNQSNQTIISGHDDNNIKIWTLSLGGKQSPILLREHRWDIKALLCTSDGKSIISASGDADIIRWSVKGKVDATYKGHSGSVNSIFLDTQKSQLLSAGNDKKVVFWDLASSKVLNQFEVDTTVNSVCMTADGQYFVVGSDNSMTTIYKISTGEPYHLKYHKKPITAVVQSPDGYYLYCASADGNITKWYIGDLVIKIFYRKEIQREIDTSALFKPYKDEFETQKEFDIRLANRNLYMEQLYDRYRDKYNKLINSISHEQQGLRSKTKHKVGLVIDSISKYNPEADNEYFTVRLVATSGLQKNAKYLPAEGKLYIPRASAKSFRANYKKATITGEAYLLNDGKRYEILNIIIHHPTEKNKKYMLNNPPVRSYNDPDAKG